MSKEKEFQKIVKQFVKIQKDGERAQELIQKRIDALKQFKSHKTALDKAKKQFENSKKELHALDEYIINEFGDRE